VELRGFVNRLGIGNCVCSDAREFVAANGNCEAGDTLFCDRVRRGIRSRTDSDSARRTAPWCSIGRTDRSADHVDGDNRRITLDGPALSGALYSAEPAGNGPYFADPDDRDGGFTGSSTSGDFTSRVLRHSRSRFWIRLLCPVDRVRDSASVLEQSRQACLNPLQRTPTRWRPRLLPDFTTVPSADRSSAANQKLKPIEACGYSFFCTPSLRAVCCRDIWQLAFNT